MEQNLAVSLERLERALEYFKGVPEERVDLSLFFSNNEFPNACGIAATPCGSLACLAGWLHTMPEYQEWLAKRGRSGEFSEQMLCRYFGLGYFTDPLFDMKSCLEEGTDKEAAIERLEGKIEALKQQIVGINYHCREYSRFCEQF